VEDTLTIIFHGVEISIAGGGADEKDERKLGAEPPFVMGALCRKMDPKIATVLKTQSRSKDQNKDKDNSK